MCIRKSYIETEDKVFFGYRGKQKRDQVLCIAFFFIWVNVVMSASLDNAYLCFFFIKPNKKQLSLNNAEQRTLTPIK